MIILIIAVADSTWNQVKLIKNTDFFLKKLLEAEFLNIILKERQIPSHTFPYSVDFWYRMKANFNLKCFFEKNGIIDFFWCKASKSCILCEIINSLIPGINIILCKVCTYENRWGWLNVGLLFSPLTPNTIFWFPVSNVGAVVFVCFQILITIISHVWYFLSFLIYLISASGPIPHFHHTNEI